MERHEMIDRRKKLVDRLKAEKIIKSKEVEEAFLSIPREYFLPDRLKKYAYIDTPLEIGMGQTISAPHMVAIMAEALDLNKRQRVLEIGAGSGYHAAIVSRIVGNNGHVYTVERIPELAKISTENLKKVGIRNVHVFIGDGSLGLPDYAPYDRIYVTCASPSIPPPLKDQLKERGIIVIPMGRIFSSLVKGIKNNGEIETENLGECAFVPLIGKYGHKII